MLFLKIIKNEIKAHINHNSKINKYRAEEPCWVLIAETKQTEIRNKRFDF
jgi:hypothetical protein